MHIFNAFPSCCPSSFDTAKILLKRCKPRSKFTLYFPVWKFHANESISEWRTSIQGWLRHFRNDKIHVVIYEDVVKDIVGELQDILRFLEMPVTPYNVWCTFLNRHGKFKRLEKVLVNDSDLYSERAKAVIQRDKDFVLNLLRKRFPDRKFNFR